MKPAPQAVGHQTIFASQVGLHRGPARRCRMAGKASTPPRLVGLISPMITHPSFRYLNPVMKIVLTFGVGLAICALL